MDNRENDPTPVHCHRCGWEGMAMNCIHGYTSDGAEDVVAVDTCPACESEDLELIEQDMYPADLDEAQVAPEWIVS